MVTVLTALDVALGVITLLLLYYFFRRPSVPPLPPGPKKLPLIGNLRDMPREREWLKFAEWGKKYGSIVSVSIFGRNFVIVNDVNVAVDILDKKSRIYSDRPRFPMAELIGWSDSPGLTPYSRHSRKQRRMFHQLIGTNKAVSKFHGMSETEAHRFLKLLLDKPEDLVHHIRRMTGSLILRITYGYQTQPDKDPYLSLSELVTEHFALAVSPGTFLVNYIPALMHLPDWFPGAGFKRIARDWGKDVHEVTEGPYQFVKRGLENGTAETSAISELLQNESTLTEEDIRDIKVLGETFFGAGSHTSAATLYAFFKTMVLYPDIQAKAQAEIGAVIGDGRLPNIEDRPNLPYVSALVSEVHRWHVVVPTGIPHRLSEDDVHEGHFMPKGSLIIPNLWYMAHNPDVYKKPEIFNPSRFLREEGREPEPDPRGIVFGFGRRICPGRLLADTSIFVTCAMVLAAFDIRPYVENGRPVMPDLSTQIGLVSQPSLFKCEIIARSKKAIALINSS